MASQSRKSFGVQFWSTSTLIILLCICQKKLQINAAKQQVDLGTNGTCGWDELNHSLLIECDDTERCQAAASSQQNHQDQLLWPTNSNEVLHLFSSRSGQRFGQALLERHNRPISKEMQLFDINSTLAVKSNRPADHSNKIYGIGGSLDLNKLAKAIDSNSLDSSYGRILNDLFGDTGARLNLLRLPIGSNIIEQHNLTSVMLYLDRIIGSVTKSRVKIMFDVDKTVGTNELIGFIDSIVQLKHQSNETTINSIAYHHKSIRDHDLESHSAADIEIFASLTLDEVPEFIDWLDTSPSKARYIRGLLVQSQESTPYDLLSVAGAHHDLKVVVLGRPRPRTKYHGDWHNAQEYAIEILKFLRHGADAFVQDVSIVDLREQTQSDCSLYCLSVSSNHPATHFKSPIFYATGHYSRYLVGARRLSFGIFTQPNMFSAHYAAFIISGEPSYYVAIVLNSNEHILPFSWMIDDILVANVNLEPKSFNTLVLKV